MDEVSDCTYHDSLSTIRLLITLQLNRPGVAVAVNGHVVARSSHAATHLKPSARVEVIRAVGGG